MELKVVEAGEVTHVALAGRLDVAGVSAVEVKFLAHTATRRKPAIVDLSGVTFLGSLGIGMLVGSAKSLALHGARMVLLDPQEMVEKTILVAKVAPIIPIVHGIEEARKLVVS
jgi:anti-sigma B factor antagonist